MSIKYFQLHYFHINKFYLHILLENAFIDLPHNALLHNVYIVLSWHSLKYRFKFLFQIVIFQQKV